MALLLHIPLQSCLINANNYQSCTNIFLHNLYRDAFSMLLHSTQRIYKSFETAKWSKWFSRMTLPWWCAWWSWWPSPRVSSCSRWGPVTAFSADHHLNYYCAHFTSLYLLLQASQYLICPSSQAILINVPYVGTFALLVGTEGNRKEYFCKLYLEQGTYTI